MTGDVTPLGGDLTGGWITGDEAGAHFTYPLYRRAFRTWKQQAIANIHCRSSENIIFLQSTSIGAYRFHW